MKLLQAKLKELGSSASPTKTADAWLQEGGGDEELQGEEFVAEEVEPWAEPVVGADVLDELVALFKA